MTMGLLVVHFADLVRMRRGPVAEDRAPAGPDDFSPALRRLRGRLAHHLIPLALMARADGEFAAAEREIIVAHCANIAALTPDERAMIDDYLCKSQPSLVQMEHALRHLDAEDAHNIEALIDTVERLIACDGRIDPGELRLLEHMRRELAALSD